LEPEEGSPTVDVLARIGEALGVPVWVLLKVVQESDDECSMSAL
jgi:hypothetical protein